MGVDRVGEAGPLLVPEGLVHRRPAAVRRGGGEPVQRDPPQVRAPVVGGVGKTLTQIAVAASGCGAAHEAMPVVPEALDCFAHRAIPDVGEKHEWGGSAKFLALEKQRCPWSKQKERGHGAITTGRGLETKSLTLRGI